MRILNMGGLYLLQALRTRGHEVLTVGGGSGRDVQCDSPTTSALMLAHVAGMGFQPDVFLYADDGNMPLLIDPEAMPLPNVYYSIDTYCNPWHVLYAYGFDHILVAQKDFVSLFSDEGLATRWFPLFCHEVMEPVPLVNREIPVAFVGTVRHANNPKRKPFLDAFRALHPLVARSGDFLQIFPRSRIVLNQTAFSEVNFRCFEVMACGAALLMESCHNGLEELFCPGENILPLYPRNDAVAAAAIAAQAEANRQHTADIAENGRQLMAREHTAHARAACLENIFVQLLHDMPHATRVSHEQDRRRLFVRASFGALADDILNPALRRHREFFGRLATEGTAELVGTGE